jgi:hypothetical protein
MNTSEMGAKQLPLNQLACFDKSEISASLTTMMVVKHHQMNGEIVNLFVMRCSKPVTMITQNHTNELK